MLRGTSIVWMRALDRLLRDRLWSWLWSRRIRQVIRGFDQFRLQDLMQYGRQILLCELFLPTRTPFSESLAQFVLERFGDRLERLKGLGPLDYRDCRRRVGPGSTFDRG